MSRRMRHQRGRPAVERQTASDPPIDSTDRGLAVKASRLCSLPDCDRPYRRNGYCEMHAARWTRYGDPLRHSGAHGSPEERFWRHVTKGDPDACWEWRGATAHGGYGLFYDGTRRDICKGMVRAHRWLYERSVGPIPPGLMLRHSCDNPPCVNPAHLTPGTQAENMRDMVERGRANYRRRKKKETTA